MDEMGSSSSRDEKKIFVFCYGSNNIRQLRDRCQNPELKALPAILHDYVRIFAGSSRRWDNGAVASVYPKQGGKVYGSVVELSTDEVKRLDYFEGVAIGVYRREDCTDNLQVVSQEWIDQGDEKKDSEESGNSNKLENTEISEENIKQDCHVYIMNNITWYSNPSEKYLYAIKENLDQFWKDPNRECFQLAVRRGADGEIIYIWKAQD